ncbi:MAG: hypothetical protein ACK5KM_13260 [Hyphomicrobiaceae bacterium]
MTARARGVTAAWPALALPLSLVVMVAHCEPANAQGGLPSFIDERRLPHVGRPSQEKPQEEKANQAAEEERQRQAEEEAARQRAAEEERARQEAQAEQQRQAAEAAARQRAAEEERAKQEAQVEQQRQAEEEAARQRAAEEERARQEAQAEQRRQAAEAAARQRAAEEERARQEAQAEQQRQAEEEAARQRAAEQQRESGNTAAGQLAGRMARGGACRDVELKGTPQPAARIEIKVVSKCLAGRAVTIAYGTFEFVRQVGADGTMNFLLDLFEANVPLALKLDDGTVMNIDTAGVNFAGVSKVAVLWSAPVNLDLHAHEYLAPRDAPGHVWAKAPGSLEESLQAAASGKRARGFISMDDSGEGPGLHAEVYTFLHNPNQRNGAVTLLIDYETRGDVPQPPYCGDGELAQIEARVIRLRPAGGVDKEVVRLGAAPCGERIPEAQRFNSDTLSDLVARG